MAPIFYKVFEKDKWESLKTYIVDFNATATTTTDEK